MRKEVLYTIKLVHNPNLPSNECGQHGTTDKKGVQIIEFCTPECASQYKEKTVG